MKKQKMIESYSSKWFVWAVFAVSFFVHCILHLILFKGPAVVIDEGLYTNLARSLAWEGTVAFRSQPVDYYYLMYPLLLVPLYWLQRLFGGDMYHYVQIFNTLLITSSVIPTYLFAFDFTGTRKKACWAALLIALMPDMLMGGFEMAESLIWPLTIWLFFFAYRLYTRNEIKYGIITAVISGMLFFTKPGAVAIGAALIGLYVLKAFTKDKRSIKCALMALAVLLGFIGAVYVVKYLLVVNTSVMGLYSKQTEEWRSSDLWVALEGIVVILFLFVFACGGCLGIVPLACLKKYDKQKQLFILATVAGTVISAIGTAFFVVPYQWRGTVGQIPAHMRYCAMIVPAFLVFSFGMDKPFQREEKALKVVLILFAVLAVFPGARIGFVPYETTSIDSMILSAFTHTKMLDADATGWIATLMAVGFTIYVVVSLKKGWSEKLQQCCFGFMIAFFLFNTLCGCINVNAKIDRTIGKDAREVNEWIGSETCLGITQQYYDDVYSYWLEGRLNHPMQQVTIDQMLYTMDEMKGIYSPFVPETQSPNVQNHETPNTNRFVLGKTVAGHLELNASATLETTKHGHFAMVTITPGERWVDTMLYGLNRNQLGENEFAFIRIFDEGRSNNGMVSVKLTAYGTGKLDIHGTIIALDETEKTYEVTVPFTTWLPLQAQDGEAYIISYTTQKHN